MPNLSVTSTCNRSCGYCFAANTMHDGSPAAGAMTVEEFDRGLDLLERSGADEASVMGGEPTIHPRFGELVDRVRGRGLRLLLLSGGMMPKAALDRVAALPAGEVTVLVNVAVPGEAPPAEVRRQAEVFARLGSRVVLGLNVASPGVELDFLLDLIAAHGLAPVVRLGLTHPILEGGNTYLHPRYFDEVGRRVAAFAARAREQGVGLEFDCGWVPCMFPDGALAELGITPNEVGLRCNPILDVLADGRVVSCYPLAAFHTETVAADDTAATLAARFAERLAPLRPLGIFRKCDECDFRARGECTGGCLSSAMRRLQPAGFGVSLAEPGPSARSLPVIAPAPKPAPKVFSLPLLDAPPPPRPVAVPAAAAAPPPDPDPTNRWSLPYIDQPPAFWDELADEYGANVADVYFPLPPAVIGSGRPPQPDRHAESFLRRCRLPKSALLNAVTLPRPVEKVAPAVVEELRRLDGEYGVTRATVASLPLARRVKDALPHWSLTASVLMEVSDAYQARLLNGLCDGLVPASRVVRDLAALKAIRAAFRGRIRLLVNEACVPGCPFRTQHFHEMASGVAEPKSLCADLLHDQPWLRLTGGWVLPQHLYFYAGVYDELKLAGRVTLQDPERFRHVFGSYVRRRKLMPHEIGGGPSSVLRPVEISDEFFAFTLGCGRRCHECTRCPDYLAAAPAPGEPVGVGAAPGDPW